MLCPVRHQLPAAEPSVAHPDSTEVHRSPHSLLGQSVRARLGLVGALLAVLWLAVYWSLD